MFVIAAALVALILGAILSRVIEPGVRVKKIMLTTNTPGTGSVLTIGSDLLANRNASKERNLCHGSSDRSRNTRHGFVELHWS
jgi:hypothetical protein